MTEPRFKILSEADLDRIHEAALEILRDPGVRITTDEARALLLQSGATLEGDDVIKIPARLVEDALAAAPTTFTMHDRTGDERLHLGQGNVYFGSGVTALFYLPPGEDVSHDFTLEDFADAAKLNDALPNLDFIATPGVVRESEEMRVELANQNEFLALVTNTTKPIMVLIADGPSLRDILDMAELVVGGREEHRRRPFVVPYLNSVSPLLFNPETIDKLLVAADRGIPVCCQAAPVMGATAPITSAGGLAISAAETLAGLVLAQLKRPGTPFLTGTVPFGMDMWKGTVTNGGPASWRSMVAMGQLARRWGLPLVGVSVGGDSKLPDEQAALDLTYYGFGAILAGVDMVFDAGNIEGALLFSPEIVAMADEAIGMMRGAMEPLVVDDETIALETIRNVGIGGTYLGEAHTLAHFREGWTPTLVSWQTRDDWMEAGGLTLRQRARDRVLKILKEHEVAAPLPADLVDAMRQIVDARARTLT